MSLDSIRTLLIIEDNPGDARLLREMLRENGAYVAELIIAQTMSEAVRCLNENPVDIILLDLGLPDAEGLAAIRRARMAAPGIPLVVLTGMDDEALAAQSLQEGAQDYLIKGQIESRGLLRALRYATERKRLERLKDEFVSTVSHELRTPLTSIAGSLGLLMGRAGEMSKPAARLLKIAHSNSERLVRLVNDILDIEKLESGRVSFDMKKVDLCPLVHQAVDAIKDFAANLGVTVRVDAAGEAVAHVRGDSDRLIQIVTNLLSNAVKFTEAQTEVTVTIDKKGANVVRLSVRDHGAGIPADFRSAIFERFAQADATNARRKGGTGLGLSIVKQIVDRLGGEVGFFDAPGGGTVFYVDLPRWGSNADLTPDQQVDSDALEPDASLASLLKDARQCMPLAPAREG